MSVTSTHYLATIGQELVLDWHTRGTAHIDCMGIVSEKVRRNWQLNVLHQLQWPVYAGVGRCKVFRQPGPHLVYITCVMSELGLYGGMLLLLLSWPLF